MKATLGLAADSGYRLPPQEVVDIIATPPEAGVSASPNGQWLILAERDTMPGIEDLARRELQLAGIRIAPAANDLACHPFRIPLHGPTPSDVQAAATRVTSPCCGNLVARDSSSWRPGYRRYVSGRPDRELGGQAGF